VLDGKAAGTWKKIESKKGLKIETSFYNTPTRAKQQAVAKAIERYKKFFS
jgi:hypothetical protein